ncbi:MAG: hypothetical protein RL404_445 [Pseudomonadota bacterium]
MSSRRIHVDLGPLALCLPEGASPEPTQPAGRSEDVRKLQALMRQGRGSQNDVGDRIELDEGMGDSNRASSIAGASASHGVCTLDDASVELLAFELSAALQAAELKRTDWSSEVRLALRPTVLRDAELGVIESEGALEYSLWVGNDDDCRWLAQQLPRLVRTLGEKLQRRLRLKLFGSVRQHLLAEEAWPAGANA